MIIEGQGINGILWAIRNNTAWQGRTEWKNVVITKSNDNLDLYQKKGIQLDRNGQSIIGIFRIASTHQANSA